MDLPIVDVLIPTTGAPASLGATLSSLANQRYPSFRVMVARPPLDEAGEPELSGLVGVLEASGHAVRFVDAQAPGRDGGRVQALLDLAAAEYVLVVDDGIFLEADLLGRLVGGLRASGGALLGSSVVDLRFRDEHRPDEEAIEFWDGPVRPEQIGVDGRAWARRKVHRGANLQHLRERLPRTRDRLYHVADIGGCVLYDTAKLRSVGGFRPLGDHGRHPSVPLSTTSATQLRLLDRYGGAGLFPSGAYRLTPIATEPQSWPPVRRDALPPVTGSPGPAAAPSNGRQRVTRPSGPARLLRHLGWRAVSRRHVGAPGVRRYRQGGTVG
ncbi:MAG TPA: glycosyltransferase family A protein [Candidatus Limnocylindrales bacterium]|nr:glycosyltransferase family A protein [Candidatus Limnocylindrales bacterium]